MLNNGRILVCDSNNQCVQVIIIAVDYVKRDRDCQLAWKLFFFADWSISTIRCSVRPVPCFQDGEFEVEVLGNFRDPLALLSWRSLMVVVMAIVGNKQTKRPSHQANCLTQDGNIAVSDYDNKWISIHEPNGKFVSKVIFRLDLSSENPKLKYFYRLEFRKFKAKIFSPIVGREQASWSKGHRSRRVRRTNCDRQQGLGCFHPPSSFRKGRLHSVWNLLSLQKKNFSRCWQSLVPVVPMVPSLLDLTTWQQTHTATSWSPTSIIITSRSSPRRAPSYSALAQMVRLPQIKMLQRLEFDSKKMHHQEKAMVSSTHQRGWLSTTRTIFLLRIGATRGFRYIVNNIVTKYFDHGPNIFKSKYGFLMMLRWPKTLDPPVLGSCKCAHKCCSGQVFDQFGSFLSYVNTSGCPLYGPQVLPMITLRLTT